MLCSNSYVFLYHIYESVDNSDTSLVQTEYNVAFLITKVSAGARNKSQIIMIFNHGTVEVGVRTLRNKTHRHSYHQLMAMQLAWGWGTVADAPIEVSMVRAVLPSRFPAVRRAYYPPAPKKSKLTISVF